MAVVEIACDESGYEGEKLVGGVTDVFAHAAVTIDEDAAARCIAELRERIRSPATVYKANHVLRSKHRPVLLWLLGSSGPLFGQAQVYLVDKAFFLVSRLVGFLADGNVSANDLYAAARSTGGSGWDGFLAAANDELRVKDLPDAMPPLDPLMPAIVRAVEYWSGSGQPVAIAHDRQTTLSQERINQLKQLTPPGSFAGLELVDSFTHPRVQVADFLAGVARKVASDQLRGNDDAELTALLRPYVDPLSVWGDEPSWSRLAP
ncbi:MAG TPA: hypothetical protein VGD15_01930 [Kribbella sp.]